MKNILLYDPDTLEKIFIPDIPDNYKIALWNEAKQQWEPIDEDKLFGVVWKGRIE